MPDTECELSLRRLRFPKELEAAFQRDYFLQTLPALRIGLGILLLIMVGQALGYYLQSPRTFPWVIEFSRPLPFLLSLALTFWRAFWRWWQLYFVALFGILGPIGMLMVASMIGRGSFWAEPAAHLAYLVLATLYGMTLIAALLRLQARYFAVLHSLVAGSSLVAALQYVPIEAIHVWRTYGYIGLPALIMLTYGACVYERLHRTAFLSNHLLEQERARSETILRNTLPDPIVDRLMSSDTLIADDHVEVTVLFADIVGFTPWSAEKPAREVLQMLNEMFSRFDRLVAAHGLEKIKTVGDCYMAVCGAPAPRPDHVEAAARLALAMQEETCRMRDESGTWLQLRIGLHTGPLIAGVIGEKRFLYDVWGDTVNTASRMESHGLPGAIQVSAEVAARLEDRFELRERGEIDVKGKGRLQTFLLEGERPA